MPERVVPDASIAQALDRASERLAAAGLAGARREATALWAAVAGKKPGDVWLSREEAPPPQLLGRFGDAVARRARGVPFAYVVGRVGFRTLDLRLDPRALIPRPETEELVGLVLKWAGSGARAPGPGPRGIAADIGTGCGCIALALAVEGAFERVIAVERSAQAAALTRENVEFVHPRVPVEVREGDLLAPLAGVRCQVIVANPPYLTTAEYAALDPAVRDFEPREALVSGVDGLEATRALLAGAAACLVPQGLLAVEIDERRAEPVRALALGYSWDRVAVHEDLFGRPRFLLAFAKEEA